MLRDDGLRGLLETLPREAAPEVGLESLFRQMRWGRVRFVAICLALLVGVVGGFLFLRQTVPLASLHIPAAGAPSEPARGVP